MAALGTACPELWTSQHSVCPLQDVATRWFDTGLKFKLLTPSLAVGEFRDGVGRDRGQGSTGDFRQPIGVISPALGPSSSHVEM